MGCWQRARSTESRCQRSDASAHTEAGRGRNDGGWRQGWPRGSPHQGDSVIPSLFPQTWLAWVSDQLSVTHSLHLVGWLPPGSHKSVHAGDWLVGPMGQSPTLAEQEVRGAEDAQGWVGEGFRSFTWWRNCVVCLKPHFIIFIIHVLFLGTQPASQMSKCFCELSPSKLVSAWPPGSYSSQAGPAGAKESVHSWPTVRNLQRGGASCGVSSSGLRPPAG